MKNKIILLAAGNSRRFHANKLLTMFHGKPLIQYVFDTVADYAFDVIVVTQYDAILQLAKQYQYDTVYQPHPEQGLASSLRLGLSHALPCDQVLFLVADQPWLRSQTIDKVWEASDGDHIVTCAYHKQPRNPTVFPKRFFKKLMQLEGDIGGRQIVQDHLASTILIETQELEVRDIDTQASLKEM